MRYASLGTRIDGSWLAIDAIAGKLCERELVNRDLVSVLARSQNGKNLFPGKMSVVEEAPKRRPRIPASKAADPVPA